MSRLRDGNRGVEPCCRIPEASSELSQGKQEEYNERIKYVIRAEELGA